MTVKHVSMMGLTLLVAALACSSPKALPADDTSPGRAGSNGMAGQSGAAAGGSVAAGGGAGGSGAASGGTAGAATGPSDPEIMPPEIRPPAKPDAAVPPPDLAPPVDSVPAPTPGVCSCLGCDKSCECCVPGTTRYCDTPISCMWGQQSCSPQGHWQACKETKAIPAKCKGAGNIYDPACCVREGLCCQNFGLLPGDPNRSVGKCEGTLTCRKCLCSTSSGGSRGLGGFDVDGECCTPGSTRICDLAEVWALEDKVAKPGWGRSICDDGGHFGPCEATAAAAPTGCNPSKYDGACCAQAGQCCATGPSWSSRTIGACAGAVTCSVAPAGGPGL